MKHQVITLPEYHEHYPYLWQSECGKYRIIRCSDHINNIFQQWRTPKWRNLSYHVEYVGVLRRGIQLQLTLLRNQNRDALRDQTLVKANDR